jgi:dTDP-4-amino-4,6-dideoxygalactose transaminase
VIEAENYWSLKNNYWKVVESMHKAIQFTQSYMPDFEEYTEEIKNIWSTYRLTNMGEKHKMLEEKLTTYLSVPNVSLFANGHLALEYAIEALELKGEVITTPFTFASTTHAIIRKGLVPVFCDINPNDYTIDEDKLESLITERTSAILPVHVYGNPCNFEKIDSIAKRNNLKVLYDAAHAFGVKIKGIGVATLGDASMFSFHATKVFHTIEGGAVTFQDPQIYTRLYELKNFGIVGPESVHCVGGNAKMNEFQAAMGLCNLRHIEDEIQNRKVVSDRYVERLSGRAGLKLNPIRDGVKSNYAYFPVLFDELRFGSTRDKVYMKLQSHNIIARKYFYPLTNSFECYADRFETGNTPIANYIADRVLTLPLYTDLSLKDVDKICDLILEE